MKTGGDQHIVDKTLLMAESEVWQKFSAIKTQIISWFTASLRKRGSFSHRETLFDVKPVCLMRVKGSGRGSQWEKL